MTSVTLIDLLNEFQNITSVLNDILAEQQKTNKLLEDNKPSISSIPMPPMTPPTISPPFIPPSGGGWQNKQQTPSAPSTIIPRPKVSVKTSDGGPRSTDGPMTPNTVLPMVDGNSVSGLKDPQWLSE